MLIRHKVIRFKRNLIHHTEPCSNIKTAHTTQMIDFQLPYQVALSTRTLGCRWLDVCKQRHSLDTILCHQHAHFYDVTKHNPNQQAISELNIIARTSFTKPFLLKLVKTSYPSPFASVPPRRSKCQDRTKIFSKYDLYLENIMYCNLKFVSLSIYLNIVLPLV